MVRTFGSLRFVSNRRIGILRSAYVLCYKTGAVSNHFLTCFAAFVLRLGLDKWELYIPSELAYGDRGSPPKIGGGEVLIFQMEILAIMGDTVPALSCTVASGDGEPEGCDDRETKDVKKVAGWVESEPTKPATEIKRIRAILGTPMSDDLRDWARRREHILSQFLDKTSSGGAAEREL